MNFTRRITESFWNLTRYPMRSSFMMLGCLVGVAALNLVVGVGSAVERRLVNTVQMYFSASSILVTSGGNPFAGGPRGDGARLTLDDIEAVASALPSIEAWDPMQVLDPVPLKTGNASATGRVVGSSDRAERVWQRGVTRGEYFDATAVGRASRVALLGATLSRALFKGDDPLDAEILIAGAPFRVIGLLEPVGTDIHGIDRDNEVIVPISTMLRRVMNVDSIRGAKLLVRDPAQVTQVARDIRSILREHHGLASGQTDDFTVVTPVEVQKLVANTKRILFIFLPLVAAVALLVGGIVSASLMLSSVSQRTSEIGLRRALGARTRDIALQFLLETSATTVVAGVLGTGLGIVAARLIAERLSLPPSLPWGAAMLGLLLAAMIGLAAGVMPARRAARLQPVDALR
jgi:putative ABC transport system permease protein